jgi:hypothetical protein
MNKKTLLGGEKVEVLVDGAWVRATFVASDYYFNGTDEVWWFDHFRFEDHSTIPEDVCYGRRELPEWREIKEDA